MKTLFFDCSSGISGNMVLGALTELTGDEEFLIQELKKLRTDGYKIEISKSVKNGISATHVNVIVEGKDEYGHEHHFHTHENGHHDHGNGHHHMHRNLLDVNDLIDGSTLEDEVKTLAKRIFFRVAQAESKVHLRPIEEVHFHEVGAIDSIVDIVGTAILIHKIKPEKILSSVVNDGHGFIQCAHGTIGVPVPATSEIFAAANVKFRQIDIDTELVTPTGAAIIAELSSDFTVLPAMRMEKIGWGAGTKDLKIPNVLKVYMGELTEDEKDFMVMETNIDDCTGEILGYTMERLLDAGALDVFYTPVFMKKNRPAYLLTVTCEAEKMQVLQDIIFKETTTIGIRYRYEKRTKLEREIVEMDTAFGRIKAKKVHFAGENFVYPEYESIKKAAEERKIPLKELYYHKYDDC